MCWQRVFQKSKRILQKRFIQTSSSPACPSACLPANTPCRKRKSQLVPQLVSCNACFLSCGISKAGEQRYQLLYWRKTWEIWRLTENRSISFSCRRALSSSFGSSHDRIRLILKGRIRRFSKRIWEIKRNVSTEDRSV